MKRTVARVVCMLGLSFSLTALAGEGLVTRDHKCSRLQERAIQEGRLMLKIPFGTLTVHGSAASCDSASHYVTRPVWRTADERFCIVGIVCNRRFQRLND